MKFDFLLSASGSLSAPCINHVFWSAGETAKEEAKNVAAELSKAGYYRFDLYDCSRSVENGGADKLIASYRVEHPEPIVTEK